MLDRTRIIELIKYPSSATTEEQEELLTLSRQYTYSPLLKILNAKIASVRQLADTNQFITSAAITAVDRTNLKKYIQADDWEVSTFVPELVKKTEFTEEKSAQETESGQPFFQEEEINQEITERHQDTEEPEKPGQDIRIMEAETNTPVDSPQISSGRDENEEANLQEQPVDQTVRISAEDRKSLQEEEVVQEMRNDASVDEEGSDAVLPRQDMHEPAISDEKSEGAEPVDKVSPKNVEADGEIPDLSEKKIEAVSPEQVGKQPEVMDPLASDLLNNIKEYRKSRDFFEKLLKEDDHDESGKSAVDDRKKTGKKGGRKTGKKSGKTVHENPEDTRLKKNAEKSGQKSPDADPDPSGTEKAVGPEANASQESGHAEPIDKDVLEKVTEEKKSEGYEVYEEEDPGVIREYLDKISGEPGNIKKLKKEEQVEIIENFIRTDPRIKNVKSPKTIKEREDLSLPSVKFKDDIISENLANIMISQGKTEQAIDIYKKLIWKFPQKKSYFAAQIEELKKK